MLRRPELLEELSKLLPEAFVGTVYRATRNSLKPDTASTSGGRWMPPDRTPVLYTSVTREGALAEISYRQASLNPVPTKPILLHQLSISIRNCVRLTKVDLERLGVMTKDYPSLNYVRTQEIGDAIALLGHGALLVPSARWDVENLVIFESCLTDGDTIEVANSESFDWRSWAQSNNFL